MLDRPGTSAGTFRTVGDRPDAQELLNAMAATVSDQIVPATTGGAQHAARVVANLCRILAREAASGGGAPSVDELRELLGDDANGPGGVASSDEVLVTLDARLAHGDPEFARAALPVLRRDVERRLAIAKPSYLHADASATEPETT